MTHTPGTESFIDGKRLGAQLSGIEVFAKRGFGHSSLCTQARYDRQAHLYPTPVLVVNPSSAHAVTMKWSLKDARKRAKLG